MNCLAKTALKAALRADIGPRSPIASAILFTSRMLFGGFLIYHGIKKLVNYRTIEPSFPQPFPRLGRRATYNLAIMAELGCSAAVMAGLGARAASVPAMLTMLTASCVALRGAPYARRELPLVYLAGFAQIFLFGAGRYSLDSIALGALRAPTAPQPETKSES